ncbi:MAG: T9SS type A sorting domain-containing protein [Muribaculaceae bacterium]|nr:T9SS type A sorting domain-containing protein [Muribaculaceae bacterium]
MKKLLLLSATLVALTSQARELTFYLGETAVKPGEKVVFTDVQKEPAGAGFDVVMAPELYLHSDLVTSNVTVKAECTSGQKIQMCAGGDCMSGTTVTKEKVRIESDQKIPLEFEYMAYAADEEAIPTVITNFTAVDPKYPNTEVTMTLEMNPNGGTATVSVTSVELVAVNGGLSYKVESPATLSLIDITGRTILRQSVSGEGFISTASLPRGLYIYRLAGSSVLSGKLQLR